MPEMIEPPDARPQAGFNATMRHFWDQSRGSLSLRMIYVFLGFFLFLWLLDLFGIANRDSSCILLGLSYKGIFHYGRLHQFLTAPLVHAGIAHLLFNMLALWVIGPLIERSLGRKRYIVLLLLSTACSTLGPLLLDWGRGTTIMGCSGVTSGLFMGLLFYYPDHQIYFWFVVRMKVKYAVWIFLAVQLYILMSPEAPAAHSAPLFGAAAALAYLFRGRWLPKLTREIRGLAERWRRYRRAQARERSTPRQP